MQLPIQCFNFSGRVASDWELLSTRKSLKRLQQKVSVVGCVFCGKLQWESSSKTSKDLLAGGAGPLGQGHRDCTSSKSGVCSSVVNIFAHLPPYYIRSVLPWKSVCEV